MKVADTISVNPSKTTLGHVETTGSSIFRSPVLCEGTTAPSLSLSKVLFPSTKAGLAEYTKYAVPLRTLFATILIATGITMLSGASAIGGTAFAVCSLCFGAFLALGLLTRPVMLGAAVYYCVCGALSLRGGAPDMSVFSLMFGSAIFGVIGSGKYSCDLLLRRFLNKARISAERRRQNNACGYKAFHNMM